MHVFVHPWFRQSGGILLVSAACNAGYDKLFDGGVMGGGLDPVQPLGYAATRLLQVGPKPQGYEGQNGAATVNPRRHTQSACLPLVVGSWVVEVGPNFIQEVGTLQLKWEWEIHSWEWLRVRCSFSCLVGL